MASIYIRRDSPFYWIKYRQGARLVQKSTGLCHDVPSDVRRAKILEAEKTFEELRGQPVSGHHKGHGWAWVKEFISVRYGEGMTARLYGIAWDTLQMFLTERGIDSPANLIRQHCFDYVNWRKAGAPKDGRRPAKHNTALLELRVLSLIVTEAVIRELARGNPCVRLKIKKEAPRVKPELTEADCAKIRQAIPRVANRSVREMLFYSFEISRYQGCRLMETRLNPQTDVEFFMVPGAEGKPPKERAAIYLRVKGGKILATVLHDQLIPLFKRLKREGRTYTWKTPSGVGYTWASGHWSNFLSNLGLKAAGITIHCNRVTVISELVRNNVPESKSQKLVGHTTKENHRLYQRFLLDDLFGAMATVGQKIAPSASGLEPTEDAAPSRE